MPQRSNDFQKLIFLIKQQSIDNATVSESKMLIDRVSGVAREVDVYIESEVGGHSIGISIECRDRNRRADVTWVESMKAKHERLPTNRLVLVSRSGFTLEATKYSASFGIEILTLNENTANTVNQIFNNLKSLWLKSFTLFAEKVVIQVAATEDMIEERVIAFLDTGIYSSEGTVLTVAQDLVNSFLSSHPIHQEIVQQGTPDHNWFEAGWLSPVDAQGNAIFLLKTDSNALRRIDSIRVQGRVHNTISEFPLQRVTLGGVQSVWAKGQYLDQDAMLVASENSRGEVKGSFITEDKIVTMLPHET